MWPLPQGKASFDVKCGIEHFEWLSYVSQPMIWDNCAKFPWLALMSQIH